MSDNKEVYLGINKDKNISYPVLIPNVKGLEKAVRYRLKMRTTQINKINHVICLD